MGIEIERKFLVRNDSFKKISEKILIHQGFLNTTKERVVRIRVIADKGYITIKGVSKGFSRLEFEYEIPGIEAIQMLERLCEKPTVKKYRYRIPVDDMIWEVDEFLEENSGLTIAEIELKEENQVFNIPEWVGKEITADPRYYNSELVKNPYSNWKE